jgi:WD40 repeat protein
MSARVDDYGDPLPRFAALRLGTTRWRHLGVSIRSLVFSADGALVYSVGDGVSAFDIATGRRVWGHRDRSIVPAVLLHRPDGDRLVVGGAAGLLTFFDAATGATRETVTLPVYAVNCVAVSPDGESLFAGGADQGGFFLSPDGELRATLPPAPGGNLRHACYSPDGATLVTTSDCAGLRLWSVADAQPVRHLGDVGSVTDRAVFTRDGARVLLSTSDGSVVVYDAATGAEVLRWRAHEAAVTGLTLSADGTRLVTRGEDRTLALWRLDDRARLATFPAEDARSHALSPDETTLAFADGSRVALVDLATGAERAPAAGHVSYAVLVAPSRGSDVVITSSLAWDLRAWSTTTGALEFTLPGARNVYWLRALPEGDRYAVMPPDDHGTDVLDLGARRITRRPETLRDTHGKWWGRAATAECFGFRVTLTNARGVAVRVKAEVHYLAITPDDRHAVFINGMRLTVWDLGKHTSRVITKVRSASSLILSPRGDEVAVRSHDTVYRVGVPDGAVRGKWKLKSGALAYSPDGRYLAVSTLAAAVLLDCATGVEVARFDVATVGRDAMCFTRDGARLVTADCDSTVLVWDVAEATAGVAAPSATKKAPTKKTPAKKARG